MKNVGFKFKLFEIFRGITKSINILISGELFQGKTLALEFIAFLSKHDFSLIRISILSIFYTTKTVFNHIFYFLNIDMV